MGNNPSTPVPSPRSHRLSKPPTNSSSSNLLVTVSKQSDLQQSSPVSVRSEDIGFGKLQRHGPKATHQDIRQKLRTSLTRTETDSPARESLEGHNERRNSLGSLVNGAKRLSRSASLKSQIPSAKGSVTQLVISQAGSRLSLVAEGTPDLDDANAVLQEIKDKAEMDGQTALTRKRFSAIPEDESGEVISAPIRRKSLYTPGIATRGPDILRKPPPPEHLLTQADRDYYFNPRHSETSPLSKLAALDFAEDGRNSAVVRTATPADLDFTQLGSLKLGTLRIMNGSASPAPSERTLRIRSGRSTPDLRKEEDYFTASEGHSSEDEATGSRVEIKPMQEVPLHDAPDDGKISPRTVWTSAKMPFTSPARCGSPLRFQSAADESPHEPSLVVSIVEKKHRPLSFSQHPTLSPDGAASIAQEYISELSESTPIEEAFQAAVDSRSELPTSPFSFEVSPVLHEESMFRATSKATEIDDMLFEDEAIVTSPIEEIEACEFHGRTSRSSHSTDLMAAKFFEGSEGSHLWPSLCPRVSHTPGKLLSKSDSGYSSSASLRSVRNTRSSRSVNSTVADLELAVVKERLPLSENDETSILGSKGKINPRQPMTIRPSILTKPKPISQTMTISTNAHFVSSESTPTLTSGAGSRPGGLTGPKKLKKPRPLSQPLPPKYITVQGHRELTESLIPPVPIDVAIKHAERLRQFPLLEHTYPSLNHTRSNETMSTGNIPPYVPIRFPSPTRSCEVLPPRPPPHRHRPSMTVSTTERSSQQQFNGYVGVDSRISDFGTVGKSLGGSPYDTARMTSPSGVSEVQFFRSSRPQNGLSKTRTFTGMVAEEAAELARFRSKTLFERQQLPFALHQKLFDDRGGRPGRQARPKTLVADIPPVPPLLGDRGRVDDGLVETLEPGLETMLPRSLDPSYSADTPAKLAKGHLTLPSIPSSKGHHASAVEFHRSWEPHRQAWKQRRKSAGEGLLIRRSVSQDYDRHSAVASATVVQSLRAAIVDVTPATFTSPAPEANLGRYEGGLSYGYEPGFGVGGSAGTRSLQNEASRKGVDISIGCGIDLSDVPIIRGVVRRA